MDQDLLVKERKDKILAFFKKKYAWISYVLLAIIVFLAVKIRIKNLPGLRDITTGEWALGPDLDPYLFLRWAKYIVEHGSLFAIDTMRYAPLGFKTSGELLLHPYMIAWFHNFASMFGSGSVTQSAALYPVFFFAITVIAFFLFSRKLLIRSLGIQKANAAALIASFFFSTIPVFLPRTIAGIPEKESSAFFFMFMSFYFFLCAWNSDKKNSYVYALLAGVFSAGMALIWGGFGYIFLVIAIACLAALIMGQIDKKKLVNYAIWLFSSFALMIPFTTRYSFEGLISSTSTAPAIFVLLSMVVFILLKGKTGKKVGIEKIKKIPLPLSAVIITAIISFFAIIILFGFDFLGGIFGTILDNLTAPAQSRLIQTVAENRQPYFTEWAYNFGPVIGNIPVFFTLFILASIFLLYKTFSHFRKKDKILLTVAYIVLAAGIALTRYSGSSKFNGDNFTSNAVYILGLLIFIIVAGWLYFKDHKREEQAFKKVDFSGLFILGFLLLSLLSARGVIRLIMILAIPGAILAGWFVVETLTMARKDKKKVAGWILFAIVLLASLVSGYQFYNASIATAQGYVPGIYNYQWQQAMSWVRDNTPENAVFAHWWDYGYWLQSIGNRATVLDGGNAISYWNHLMGRHALTSPNSKDAAEFLFAHNTTHLLIDSTDIGKYSAYSYIGSDETLDRRSYIQTFAIDKSQTQETKNSTTYLYRGGFALDGDIVYEENGEKIFLPGGSAGLAAVLVDRDTTNKIIGVRGIFVYQNKQHSLPIRYVFDGELVDLGSGLDSSVFLFPLVTDAANGLNVEPTGAMLYLSEKVYKSQIARLYLYGEEDEYFKLAHSEGDLYIEQIKEQANYDSDFMYYRGFRGPIKIWEISYPGIEFKEEYLNKEYPDSIRWA